MLRFFTKRRKTGDEEFAEPEAPATNNHHHHHRSASQRKNAATTAAVLPESTKTGVYDELCCSREPELTTDRMRMVILECEPRRAIFDSATIIPIGNRPTEGLKLSSCKKFELLRKQRDLNALAQLIWGAVPTPQGADALKFHQLEDDKVLISRMFSLPRMANRMSRMDESVVSSDNESQYQYNTVRSLDGGLRNSLCTTAPPEQFTRVRNSSLQLDTDEPDEPKFSPHRLSKDRRIRMSHKTSLCESVLSINSTKTRSRLSSCGSQVEDEVGRQVSLGIVMDNRQRNFIFQHIPIVEMEMSRLENRVVNAAMHTPTFLDNVHKAWEEFQNSICFLYNAPRLSNPVWLSLAEKDLNDCDVASRFCSRLAHLVKRLDTKQTKFFLSNIVSTILMHHMSWVASVASPQAAPTTPLTSKNLLIGTALNPEASYIPYNPHMAQYLEISGSVGHTHRSTKTVVSGTNYDLIAEILHVLSYFIRCSTVQHRHATCEDTLPLPISQSFSPEIASPEAAGSPPIGSLRSMAFSPDKLAETDDGSSCSLDSIPADCGSCPSGEALDCLGRSLLAGPSMTYSPHFVLSGLFKHGPNYDEAFVRILDDVRLEESALHRVAANSLSSSQSSSSVCDAQMPDSVVILADTTDWSVKIVSSDGLAEVFSPSESVVSMLEQFAELHSQHYAPKFLITFIEDILFEILGKSLSLVEMLQVSGSTEDSTGSLLPHRVSTVIDCDQSDLRLVVNVASVYYPPVLNSVL